MKLEPYNHGPLKTGNSIAWEDADKEILLKEMPQSGIGFDLCIQKSFNL